MREFLMQEDARILLKEGYCESCLSPAKNWLKLEKDGCAVVHGEYDSMGNLVGFLCPTCGRRINQ